MNREIKFRAWYSKDLQMLSWFDLSQSAWNTFRGDKPLSLIYDVLVARKDDFNVMQYTGIKDKNGVEIYEGDILNITNPDFKYFIVFENCAFLAYHLTLKDFDGTHLRWGLLSRFGELNIEIEIIGNIHQNPELL